LKEIQELYSIINPKAGCCKIFCICERSCGPHVVQACRRRLLSKSDVAIVCNSSCLTSVYFSWEKH